MISACLRSLALIGLGPLILASAATASDWPTFRGADRTAVAPDTDLLDSWPADGPPLVWETKGAGRGYASLAIVGDRIFTLGDGLSTADDTDEYLCCFERTTGRPLWKTKTGGPWTDGPESWQSSRSTPTVDGDMVYVITPFGQLVACLTADGHVYIRYADGTVSLVKADPTAYQEVGSFKVPGSGERPSWAHMVIVDGKLYLREGDAILCYDVQAK